MEQITITTEMLVIAIAVPIYIWLVMGVASKALNAVVSMMMSFEMILNFLNNWIRLRLTRHY